MTDLTQMSLKESEGVDPIDENISNSDLQLIINEFLGNAYSLNKSSLLAA